jgi:hypothetical protein
MKKLEREEFISLAFIFLQAIIMIISVFWIQNKRAKAKELEIRLNEFTDSTTYLDERIHWVDEEWQ